MVANTRQYVCLIAPQVVVQEQAEMLQSLPHNRLNRSNLNRVGSVLEIQRVFGGQKPDLTLHCQLSQPSAGSR